MKGWARTVEDYKSNFREVLDVTINYTPLIEKEIISKIMYKFESNDNTKDAINRSFDLLPILLPLRSSVIITAAKIIKKKRHSRKNISVDNNTLIKRKIR